MISHLLCIFRPIYGKYKYKCNKNMMDVLIRRFPEQLREALEIGRNAKITPSSNTIQNIYVAGMGGSGIGANFVIEFTQSELKVPYLVGKGYDVPSWVGPNTLAIASSYSGNTEETISAFYQLIKSGAKVVVIASGGKLIELAKEHDLDHITLPNDWPSPRACLGYSLVQQLAVLNHLNLISDKCLKDVASSAELLDTDMENIREKALKIAGLLENKLPVIYTTDRMEAVAIRFRQQINENAKVLCWHHVIPEMNHNELVGWRDDYKNVAVVIFRNADDHSRNITRIDISKEVFSNCTSSIIEIFSKGNSLVERAFYLVHLGDWISVYLADLRKMDAIEVKVIDYLKSELSKV
jgi:glucose/mannose-6-phosphate isomerase